MYGIDFGVTPPGTIRKMNQDNNCLFNANLMNELKYVYVCYVYDSMHDYDYDHVGTHVRLRMRTRALDTI
jgi:hypothetical protein